MRVFVIALAIACVARPASAELKLESRDGRVTLVARDVSVRQILSEWSKVGGTQIVNLDRISGAPVTLQLDGVSEDKALEVILRSVAGYVAAPRRPENPGISSFDRILVLAASTPPAVSPRPAAAPPPAFPPPAFPAPRDLITPAPAAPPLFPTPADDNDADADDGAVVPRPAAGAPMPTAPGVTVPVPGSQQSAPGGTSVPGVVVPVPRSPNQPQTAQPPNPDR